MNELEMSSLIKTLSDNYANNHISLSEYRYERRRILNALDVEFNQFEIEEEVIEELDNNLALNESSEIHDEVSDHQSEIESVSDNHLNLEEISDEENIQSINEEETEI